MSGSSPAERRSRQYSSPSRSRVSDYLAENRHTELSHQDALIAAQAEHERVRQLAIRVYKDHEFKEEHRRLQEKEDIIKQQQRIEEQRIRNEERLRAEEERLRALKAKTVPKLPPAEPRLVQPQNASLPTTTALPGSQPSTTYARTTPSSPGTKPSSNAAQQSTVFNAPALKNGTKVVEPVPPQLPGQGNVAPSKPSPLASTNTVPTAQITSTPPVDEYVAIHQNLKKLRAFMLQQSKALPLLKARMGDMRRELRKSLGQIVTEKGGNKKQIATIQALLQESLNGSVPSPLVDASQFVTDQQREPMDGAVHNEPQLPSLFLYLLNIFSKTIINQFINECGAQPKAADPLGVIAAQVFSNKLYQWRGKSLVDVLMAKFRVACPVLFGYRGSEKTEQGRLRLGWTKSKDGAGWAPEQQHTDKMKGLAVGYAAISLRDFSKSPHKNPWPPSKYWACLARIVNTPPAEISNTQCVVLRAMIEIYEERFLLFYGSAAIAALRTALVDFPNKALVKTPGTAGLQVLAQMMKRDIGLEL